MTKEKKHITFGTKQIDFFLSWRDRKTLGIKVHPDGNIDVIAPNGKSESEVIKKVISRASWIIKQLRHFKSFSPLTPQRIYVNGETHLYLGRQYRLKIIENKINDIKLFRGYIEVYTLKKDKDSISKILDNWYREKAIQHLVETIEKVFPKFKKFDIAYPEIIIRKMNKRWGSCTPAGRIILNPDLVKAPKGSIEYVIIHELCHLVHHSHNKDFITLQEKLLPDWKKWKDRLEMCLV